MSLFDNLVDEALRSQGDLAPLRPVVEKELLHHDILREMSAAGLLSALTFIGGTCLRACYGSSRLSEDLDFTGGESFEHGDLASLAEVLTAKLETRYGLPVRVSEPVKTGGNVSTWKLAIETRPDHRHLPAQRIHLDICAIPSHDPRPMMLRNLYGVDFGTSGLILSAESREEIFADKVIALAFRQNRIKNRDLWDIAWLVRSGIDLAGNLIPKKLQDHHRDPAEFTDRLTKRLATLRDEQAVQEAFVKEMRRFLAPTAARDTVEKPEYWKYLCGVMDDVAREAIHAAG